MTKRWIFRAVVGAILGYAVLLGLLFTFQRTLQYRPDTAETAPASVGLARAEVVRLAAADGERLVAWWIAPRDDAKPVLLYFHGNGASIANRARRFGLLTAGGAGLLAVSYRGYGGSTGSPSERGIMLDAEAAHAFVADKVPGNRIVAYGESLGTGVALGIAVSKAVVGLVLDSPYTSLARIAGMRYPWAPVDQLMLDPFRAHLVAPRLKVPVLGLHCADDPITPLIWGRELFDLITAPKTYRVFPGRCHTFAPEGDAGAAIAAFLTELGFPGILP